MHKNNPSVYSTERGRLCPDCGKPQAECTCKKKMPYVGDGVVRVQRESKGRKGKTVTTISGIQANEQDLRALLSELKRRCGSGGSIKEGVVEIQGDHRDIIIEELKSRGFHVKKAGG